MSEGRLAIETAGLTRRFEPGTVVDRLDLNVAKADVYGFLGPNGAGKTTTIRMLLGLIRPDAGIVRIFGAPFRAQLLASIGSLVETPSLYPHLSGRENLEVTRRLLDAPRVSVDRVLQVVRLSPDAARLVREYSLEMRQRLGGVFAAVADHARNGATVRHRTQREAVEAHLLALPVPRQIFFSHIASP